MTPNGREPGPDWRSTWAVLRLRNTARLIAAFVLFWGFLVVLGSLVTRVWAHSGAGKGEVDFVRDLVDRDSGTVRHLAGFARAVAGWPTLLVVSALLAVVSALVWRRLREPLFVASAVGGSAALAALAARVVDRDPVVGSLPAFPSVAATAATACYGTLALIVVRRIHSMLASIASWIVVAAVVVVAACGLVATGHHHPTDVIVGVLLGAFCLWMLGRELPLGVGLRNHRREPDNPLIAAVVFNPTKVDNVRRAEIEVALRRAGAADVHFLPTAAEDGGIGAAKEAASDADVVCACGGDGTVQACATALAGGSVPLAILPSGTGNLLARNLGIPMELHEAAWVAVHGRWRPIDLGTYGAERFCVMAGIGFDATMLSETPEKLKRRIGSSAYFLSGMRQLWSGGFSCEVTVDGAEPVRRRVRTVLVGNVGVIQGGVQVIPDAAIDDGYLDILLLSARRPWHWVPIAARILTRRDHPDYLYHLRGREVVIRCTDPQPTELDGEVRSETTEMVVGIERLAIEVCVPRP
jgi:YegS/Rv2252/BmrU family lipid kinase